ncbi:MAG TPA: hypothetical protein DCP28_34155, partial [Cytophagales bacterium]|nr:hypothetical protein [Cytophagales bacterium]
FIAQEVKAAADALGYDFSGVQVPEDENQSMWGIRYAEFVVPLVKAIQELSAENQLQTDYIAQQGELLNQYEASLQRMEQRINMLEAQAGPQNDAATTVSASKE